MIVYGDHVRSVRTKDCRSLIEAECRAAEAMPSGIERHGRLCGAFILAGELAQGVADAEMAIAGHDDHSPGQSAVMAMVMALARCVIHSWKSGFTSTGIISGVVLADNSALPETVTLRQPEGYAHYALYPESFASAAASLGIPRARIIGLRSIGTSLAAMVACVLRAPAPITLRPVGHPFRRELKLSPALSTNLASRPDVPRIVVDEGPGLSGSSFGAVTSWLTGAGIAEPDIICLPGHSGEPGAMGSPEDKLRYARLRKAVVPFDALCLHTDRVQHRIDTWFTDLAGAAIAPVEDLSGGAWRAHRRLDAPAVPARERRKFLLHTESGSFLLKFAGLGAIGLEKWERARRLATRGFVPEPLGFRHGFIIERWHGEARPPEASGAAPIEAIGRYLGTRAALFPASPGADLQMLGAMARHNTEEALGAAAARALVFNADLPVCAVHVDGRLHRWEWLSLPDGRLLKSDALDHSTGHDLIGCQDIAWDVAAAAVEFDLAATEVERLRCIVSRMSGIDVHPDLVADCILYYCAFQSALWGAPPPDRYLRHIRNREGCRERKAR